MSFTSGEFYLFFPLVTILYFAVPQRFRWFVLLVASCIFYMAFIPAYILVLLGLIIVDYTAALLIERARAQHQKYILLVSILAMTGTLFVFKYFNFFNANVAALAHLLDWNYSLAALSLALPLGLSFHTFQSLSYVIEVYRGKQKAEHNFGIYALYVLFYPQLVAGPIERPQHLLHQFYDEHTFDYERVKIGLMRMMWGLFKKTVIADHLALLVSPVYGQPSSYDGLALLVATILFTLELYFDFSAYCDIALGAAQVMGFTLVENFDRPFAATSIAEFWRRWHISLSSWFRDYVYYPLLLSRKKITPARIYGATLFTFLVMGFWHGANWTFGIFGLLHGIYIVVGTLTQKVRARVAKSIGLVKFPRLYRALQTTIVFALVSFSLIFFRAQSMGDALYIAVHLFAGFAHILNPSYIKASLFTNGLFVKAALALPLVVFVFWFEYMGRIKSMYTVLAEQPLWLRWAFYWALISMDIFLNTGAPPPFIYFQF